MAQVGYSKRALGDLERLADFLDDDPQLAQAVASSIREAISVLERHPLMGHRIHGELRELVISRGRTGYVALYRFFERQDVVVVLAIRHQREAGYH